MKVWYYLISIVVLFSCSPEDSFLENEHTEGVENQDYIQKNIEHNKWTYAKMSSEYFWYKDMPDSIELDFKIDPDDFFESLLSSQDRFSWCEKNLNYNGIEEALGLEYQAYEVCGSIVNRVLCVHSNRLKEKGLSRGDYFIFNGDNILKVRFVNNQISFTKSISISEEHTKSRGLAPTISLDTIYNIKNKRIGYFIYDQFESSVDVAQIAIRLKNRGIDNLILDLRYNPGGYVSTSKYLASMLAPKEKLGALYQLQRFNDIQTQVKQNQGGSGVDSVFLDKGFVTFERNLNLNKIIILTSKNTASASEALIIGLRPYMDVVTIGTTSCGKDVGSYTIADNRYKYQLQPITFRYYNALNDSTPTTGIIPDIEVADDLDHERGDVNEALLKTAINYLVGNIAVNETRSVQSSSNEKEYGKSSIEIRNNL